MASDPPISAPPSDRTGNPARQRSAIVWRRLGVLAGVLVAILVVVALYRGIPAPDPASIIEQFSGNRSAIILSLIVLMVAHNFMPVPGEVIAMCAGAALGLSVGAVTIWIGAMLGAALAFGLSRHFGRSLVERRAPPEILSRVDRIWDRWGTLGLFSVRLLPLISFNLVNYAAGLTPVRWVTFLWTTAIGILPVLLISVAAGAGLNQLPYGKTVFFVVAALLLFAACVRPWLRRRNRQAASSGDQPE